MGDDGIEVSVRVDSQSKNKSFISLLISRVRGLVRKDEMADSDKGELSERTLVVGGVAAVAGVYFMMRSLFPWGESEALSQAFAENVREWVYKCGSAIGSCSGTPASLMSSFSR